MMPPQMMSPQGGGMPPGMPQGNANMFAQMALQGQQRPPQGPPPPAPMNGPQMGPQGHPGQPPQPPQGGQQSIDPQMLHQMIQMIMQQGRGGDTLLAHLTPGELEVPKEVQTPKVLATLKKAYEDKGVQPQQFMAGSPQSSKNPSTGLPEYNFMSAFLPAALGLGASVVAPELLPALGASGMSAGLMSAIGGGLGTTAGELAIGKPVTQAALAGLGSGAGGYMMGNIGSGLTAGGNIPAGASMSADQVASLAKSGIPLDQIAKMPGGSAALGMGSGIAPTGAANIGAQMGPPAPPQSNFSNLWGAMPGNMNAMSAIGSAAGGAVGNAIGAPTKPNTPNYPPGFNTPMTPVGQLPSAQTQLGQSTTKMPAPSFQGFNPATNNPAAYNFFPTATNGG